MTTETTTGVAMQPRKRHASPQAWRRLRQAVKPNEDHDIARDIAQVILEQGPLGLTTEAELENQIRYALSGVPWDRATQA